MRLIELVMAEGAPVVKGYAVATGYSLDEQGRIAACGAVCMDVRQRCARLILSELLNWVYVFIHGLDSVSSR